MDRYAAFLRRINISGKNKIAMSELKAGFEDLGFSDFCFIPCYGGRYMQADWRKTYHTYCKYG